MNIKYLHTLQGICIIFSNVCNVSFQIKENLYKYVH